jgi:hypothetical protein
VRSSPHVGSGSKAAVQKRRAEHPVKFRYPTTCCTAANWRNVPQKAAKRTADAAAILAKRRERW